MEKLPDEIVDTSQNMQTDVDSNVAFGSTPAIPNEPLVSSPVDTPFYIQNISHPLLLSYTPNGTEGWIRKVELEFLPTMGRAFETLEEALKFYEVYALACGFTPRLHTTKRLRDGTIYKKTMVCNRQGFRDCKVKTKVAGEADLCKEVKKAKNYMGKPKKTKLIRIGCNAKIRFTLNEARTHYVIDQLEEAHNHILCSLQDREFSKIVRTLSHYHKQMIVDHSKVNIGPTKTFRISKEYAKGFDNIGASLAEFKNFQRDVKCFIGLKDAEMFINVFEELTQTEDFYFAYEVDDCKNLTRVFWSDERARLNYSLFGDGFSYDPTYGTNKYSMVFTPFTGLDHHKKSVTFGAALLAREDEESFVWLFRKFLDAMDNKEPQFIITDQDPAIKKAVPHVFKTARHRLCMWHIMQKIQNKVGAAVCDETEFLSKFSSVVWDCDLEPAEFEEKWFNVINEHGLENNSWLNHMFKIREKWIPAYSRDIQMGCLLRTTQRSESGNSFFKRFENKYGTLVEFWLRFKSAMDQQRHTQKRLDSESKHSDPKRISPLDLEVHATKVYTHALFYEFQDELRLALCYSGVEGYSRSGDLEITDVRDAAKKKTFQVMYNSETVEVFCSCKLFERIGQLCSHIILVFSGKSMKEIPERYITKRWRKNANDTCSYFDGGRIVQDCTAQDVKKLEISKVWSEFHQTIGVIGGLSVNHMKELALLLKQFREKSNPTSANMTKDQEIEMLLGCKTVTEVHIKPPKKAINKGSGKKLDPTETSTTERPKRRCRNCKQMANHDKRNCPNPYLDSENESGEEDTLTEAIEAAEELTVDANEYDDEPLPQQRIIMTRQQALRSKT